MPTIADRIEVDSNVHHGTPVIAGTRVPVRTILGLLGNGVSVEAILSEYYDHITREDVLACIRIEETFDGTLFIVDANKYRKRKKP